MISAMWNLTQKSIKRSQGPQKWHPSFALMLLVLILIAFGALLFKGTTKPSSSLGLSAPARNAFQSSVQFHPSVEILNGTDIIWQIPNSPKAALFIAHGCSGRAANFWDRSAGCPNCVGLPEERLIVLHALARKFAVLTVSSLGRCWSFGKERKNVKWIIKRWIQKKKLGELPVVALGASSGGHFVSALAAEMKFSSIVLMIAEGVFDRIGMPKGYPPTLFVHMPKDHSRMELIGLYMEDLRQKGVDVREVRCLEFPVTAKFLSDRITGVEESFAIKLVELFHERGFIDEKGYMRNDGRATRWKQALRESQISVDKNEWLDHIQEELNLAFGYHEMTSLQSDDIFDWFESHIG